MILLSEIFEILQGAEFNSLSIVENEGGEAHVDTKEYNRLIKLVNAGLAELHKRFNLKSGSVMIQTTEGVPKYVLDSKYAKSTNPDGYILDSVEDPFTDDILEITRITSLEGRELILNNRSRLSQHRAGTTVPVNELCESLFTLDYRTVRVPVYLRDSQLLVMYKSSGTKIKDIVDNSGDIIKQPEEVVIELPAAYINALTYYVASRVYNSKGAETIGRGIFHEGNNYRSSYEAEINTLLAAGLEVDVMVEDNVGFYKRGFV